MNTTKTAIVALGELIGLALLGLTVFTELSFVLGLAFLILWNFGYILGSLRKVEPNELALETFFGKPIKSHDAGAGLVFVPFGFFELRKFPSETNQFQIPAEPELVFKGHDDEPLPNENMVRPMRIFTGQEQNVDDNDPLTRRLHGTFSAIIRWRIKEPMHFIRNVGQIDYAEKQLRDTAEKALVVILGKKSPREIIASMGEINKSLTKILQKLVNGKSEEDPDRWGVEIEDFQLLAPDFGQTLSKKISESVAASFGKKIAIEEAEGTSAKIRLEGFAKAEVIAKEGIAVANAKELLLKAEAMGYKEIADKLGIKEKEVILQVEAIKQAMAKAGENGHVFFNMPNIASMAEMFSAINSKK